MRSVQDVGKEILGNTPDKFYVFCGPEYGIKEKYLEILKSYYGGRQVSLPRVSDVVNLMKTHSLLPPAPSLYVVRYDEEFLSSLSDSTQQQFYKLDIRGTLVCIYEDAKATNKLDKFLPNFSVTLPLVDPKYILRYLRTEFPELNDRFVNLVSQHSRNYGHARRICRCMRMLSAEGIAELYKQSDAEILQFFGGDTTASTDADISRAFAAKDFSRCVSILDTRGSDLDSILYTLLSTLLELEKLKCKKYATSIVKDFTSRWTLQDICNMFLQVYQKLDELRSTSSDAYSALVYLFALLRYQTIPEVDALCS